MGALSHVIKYRVFYDRPTEAILEEMAEYDLVIVEPVLYSAADIRRLQSRNTMVFGYLSVMQASTWNQEFYKKLSRRDFYRRNGQKLHFPMWDSYLMDLTSPNYRKLLHDRVREQIAGKGFDGLFFDTVGDIDDQFADELYNKAVQRCAFVSLLEEIQDQYANLLMIQNWGFETLTESTAPFMNGLMWENFHADTARQDLWTKQKMDQLAGLMTDGRLSVFTVSFRNHRESGKTAAAKGFIHYSCTSSYNKWGSAAVRQPV